MKYYKARHLVFIIPIIFFAFAFIFFQTNEDVKRGSSEVSYVKIGSNIIKIDLAISREEQIRGLSGRKSLCPDCGLLFIFPQRQVRSFWMKNMNFPIDIIWIDGGKIVKIDKDLPPEGEFPEKSYSSVVPADIVLEVNAGYSDRHNIKEGDKAGINL